ncbi:ARM repeat-containing protein [Annulohypoxylon truncatum]|uniref:ARM repeat-containing protein n=1 Tax=Annulohypoxylon truncatum TaxID=327061 RepID=UPI002008DD15|nr:ARM repeat-containing protein [Annulohypoxylon truncatum]KAI1205398.1 ARM repeat-containing protein [Annulohypoxylon truncatum]
MDFAIEAPGAASPFSLDELYRALEAAQSYDNSQRQAATQQLSTWESEAGYYPTLQTIFLNKDLSTPVRLLAIIQLKNGIDRYWRLHKVHNSIPRDVRHVVRERLFQGTIGESDRQLAQLNALVAAKIIRIDFPTVWSSPLADLIRLLRDRKDGNQVELCGALMLLLRVVKELGTARLRKSQTTLQSITPEIVYVLCEIYNAKFTALTSFLASGPGDERNDEALLAMEISLYALKTLRRLLLVGYESPHNDKNVQNFWSSSQDQFQVLFGFVDGGPSNIACYVDVLTKLFMQYSKLHIEMAEQHPSSFVLLPNSLNLVRAYWFLTAKVAAVFSESVGIRHNASNQGKAKTEGPILEKIALKGLLLLRACVQMVHRGKRTILYRSSEAVQEEKQAIEHLKVELLKDEFIIEISNVIVTRFLLFRQADLDAWEEDPQEWEQQEETEGNAYQWEVRPCAEKLFLDLLIHYKGLLLQHVLSYFVSIEDPQTTLVAREAIYTAIGLSANVVYEEVNFEDLLKKIIVADAQRAEPSCQILRRRIAILLSQWVPVQSTAETRPLVYEIFRHFLNPNDQYNDIVVRITTARRFKVVCDDIGFDGKVFSPYASDVLVQLINLLGEVEVDEAKLAILESTRTVILRMETHVSHFGDMIMNAVPNIWQAPAGDLGFMMKQSVLAIIQTLVMSMKTDSRRYHQMILPLIVEATQEGTELFLYLIEEALELWSNILHQTEPPMSPDFLSLIPTGIKLLSEQNEHTSTLVDILGCYIVLAPETILLDQYRGPTVSALSRSLGSRNREQVNLVVKYTESLIRLSHELGGAAGLQVLVKDMMTTGALPAIFEGIHDTFEAHQTSGPKKRQSLVTGLTLVDYFTILSRIAVLEPQLFVEVLVSLGPLDQVWRWLSTEWFLAFDTMADYNQQKLNLLSLTRLLELPQPMQDLALQKLQDYLSMWTSVLVLILDGDLPNPGIDTLVLTSEPEPTEWDTPKDVRERALFASDPVKRVQALDFVQQSLKTVTDRIGMKAFEDWTANVDKEVLVNFASVSRFPLPTGEA